MTLQWDDPKDPDERLDYQIDWVDKLDSGDTILTSVWFIDGADSTLVEEGTAINGAVTLIWLTGGTLGVTYELTNRVTTSGGRIRDETVRLRVRAK